MKTLFRAGRHTLAGAGLAAAVLWAGCARNPRDVLEEGLRELQAGNHAAAIAKLEKARRKLPASATLHANLGVAYWRAGQLPKAADALRHAADLAPRNPLPLEYLVQLYGELGEFELGRKALDEYRADWPEPSARALAAAGALEWAAGNRDKAADLFRQAIERRPDYAAALYNLGVAHRGREGGHAEAAAYFRQFLAVAPDDPHADRAREFLAKAVPPAVGPRGPAGPGDRLVAEAHKAIGNESFDEALVLLKQATEKEPANANAWWELAGLYDRYLKDRPRAVQVYQDFWRRFPDDPRSRGRNPGAAANPEASRRAMAQGVASYRAQDWEAAIGFFRQALRSEPRNVDAAYNLGLALRAKGDLAGARGEFDYVLSLAPHRVDALYMLATVFRALGSPSKAAELLETALARQPDHPAAHLLLGYVFQELGSRDKARQHFARYVELAPANDASAQQLRAWLQAGGGR